MTQNSTPLDAIPATYLGTLSAESIRQIDRRVLAELYASNPTEYLDKAVASQHALLVRNPNRAEPYKLLVGGEVYEDETDGDGMLVEDIPEGTELCSLELSTHTRQLRIGPLDAVDAVSGAGSRMHNMCYGCALTPQTLDEDTRHALMRLQTRRELDVTGELDAPTAADLEQQHDG